MTRSLARAVALGALALAPSAGAQGSNPAPAGAPALPAGHPGALPAGHPGALPAGHPGALPAGHPGTLPAGHSETMPAGHPEAAPSEPPEDRVAPAPDLRPGTIEVHVHDGSDAPIPNIPLRLGILHNDVGQGDSRSELVGSADNNGVAVFRGLEIGTAFSYRVSVPQGPASFAAEPLRLDPNGGQRVLLHVYPVVRDIREALVGMRGVVFVQPRDDVFHIEMNFQVLNIGASAWVPDNVHFSLPAGAKAFRVGDEMKDTRAEKTASGDVTLLGTFSPGQHEVGFQFQLDNSHDRSKSLRVSLPPHVAELRVIAEGARGMAFRVDGFPESEAMQGQDGSHLLVTARHLVRGDAALESIDITLENLPVPSAGRWYAVGLAALFAAFGLFQMARRNPSPARKLARADEAQEAEDLVLTELVQLERLRKNDGVGPRTYEETRVELLDALARLDARGTAHSA